MSRIALEGVSKQFGGVTALRELDLTAGEGEFLTLLGPSGCGKTTTLRMIAGFVEPTGGRILFDGKDVTNLPPRKREVGMVFQDYALFPHLNVEENIGFGMRERGASRPAVKARVRELLELVRLPGMAQRYPAELSGGQRQRVAIARAVAYPPRVLLMDEPLGALDLKLREAMQQELRRIQRALSITTVSVTHDQTEAMIMSDHIVVMNHGRVEQIGSADEIYNRPRSRFVAEFVGRINFLAATVTGQDGGLLLLDVGGTRVVTPIAPAESAGDSRGETFALAIRPEHLEIRSPGDATGDRNSLGGRVTGTFFVGNLVHVMVEIGAGESVTAEVRPADGVPSIGEAVQLSWDPARAIPLH